MNAQTAISHVEVWGGMECTINRLHNTYIDQLHLAGHYSRAGEDIKRFQSLGIKKLRYPVLWEKHNLQQNRFIDCAQQLQTLHQSGIEPVVGLVHHGSGPSHVSFFDGSFEKGLKAYASSFAQQFPWVKYYTPVNEPLTTARFCGLYGLWYPHRKCSLDFLKILLSECRAIVLSMQAIRQVNPEAKLVQTEDIGKIHSTPLLQYQSDFENNRRWLSFDLLCGKINEQHELWEYLIWEGITKEALEFFTLNPCPPDIIGINHYLTSERWLDEAVDKYPQHCKGGNGTHEYVDVEAVRAGKNAGPKTIFKETWERYKLPIAITEVHLHCTREEQMRWLNHIWTVANELKQEGVEMVAITAWALLGSYDWCSLLTEPKGIYEAGVFDVRSPVPRSTALAKMIANFAKGKNSQHPVLEEEGWWQKPCAIHYLQHQSMHISSKRKNTKAVRPLIIIGKTGTLGKAFSRICGQRHIHHVVLGRDELNITNIEDVNKIIAQYNPWAIVNAAGYVRVDDAEHDKERCFLVNTTAPEILSKACKKHGVQFITYSSDLVFDGAKSNPYIESDLVAPLNVYGQSKAMAESKVWAANKDSLIIRTSAFFGPWDKYNFVYHAFNSFKNDMEFTAPNDIHISPTYVPDLVNVSLDLLLDEATGVWNIANKGSLSWAMLAQEVAERSGYRHNLFKTVSSAEMKFTASRPTYSVLATEKGYELPLWDNALDRFFREQELIEA